MISKHTPLNLVLGALLLCALPALASDTKAFVAEKQKQLISVLTSNSPAGDKALACKGLAIYGGKDAVKPLAALLPDKDLSSWARIALEAIPDSAADKALRDALDKTQGRLQIGVINSLGVRRDAKAVSPLVKLLKSPDLEVASAAAEALGHIGGSSAAKALTRALPEAPPGLRSSVAEGCVLCAENYWRQGKDSDAIKLYDLVRVADVPQERFIEATRGAVLVRGDAGIPMLLELLRSNEKVRYMLGLATARELPGRRVTEALAAELDRTPQDRQVFLLLALAARNDPAVWPVVVTAARDGSPKLRLAAVGILDRRSDIAELPVLLECASGPNKEVAAAALAAIARLPGNDVDAALLARFPDSSAPTRRALIILASQRNMTSAMPQIVKSAEDTDPAVRVAAIQAIGTLGGDVQASELLHLIETTKSPKDRENLEQALISVCGRRGASAGTRVAALLNNDNPELRIIALHALASAGGPDALKGIKGALKDPDETVRDEAVRTLVSWPSNWPDDNAVAEPLLTLAKSGEKPSHQVLGLRAYLQYVQGDKHLKDDEKVAKVAEVSSLIQRPEEKKLAIATISDSINASAMEMLISYTGQPDAVEDACAALVKMAGKKSDRLSKEDRRKALQTVVQQTKDSDTKKSAEKALSEKL